MTYKTNKKKKFLCLVSQKNSIKYLLLISVLPNFKNDTIIEIIINKTEQVITLKSLDTNNSTATLPFNKITRLFCNKKAAIIPNGFINTKTKLLQTMKINYRSNNCKNKFFIQNNSY